MDKNSLAAYRQMIAKLSEREQRVYACLKEGGPQTARDVLRRLFPECKDPNLVRPRITDLIKKGLVLKKQKSRDMLTGMVVWEFAVAPPPEVKVEQLTLGSWANSQDGSRPGRRRGGLISRKPLNAGGGSTSHSTRLPSL